MNLNKVEVIDKKLSRKKDHIDMIGPNPIKIRKMDYHDLFLQNLPSANQYEISYMHRDIINNILVSSLNDIIITFSVDGHIKFWKKMFTLIEFIKNFKAHNGLINNGSFSKQQDIMCSVGIDKTLKIFDVINCDLRVSIRLQFIPYNCEFIPQKNYDWNLISIGQQKTGRIIIIDPEGTQIQTFIEDEQHINDYEYQKSQNTQNNQENYESRNKNQKSKDTAVVKQIITFHHHPIKFIKMNWKYNVCFSIDQRAFVEIWDPFTFDFPTNLAYSCKVQADFLKLLQANSVPLCLNISSKGTYVVIMLKDRIIRIFSVFTGRLLHTISETIKDIVALQEDANNLKHSEYSFESNQFQKKMCIQKDMQISKQFLYNPNLQMDDSEQYIIFCSIQGIKFYSLRSKCIERIIGFKQNERFLRISLFQGRMMRNPTGSSSNQGDRKATDNTLYCTAFKKARFFIFSNRQPQSNADNAILRDVINQRPNKQQMQIANQLRIAEKKNQVVLQTTMGDIHILLYTQDCKKTCQNFIKLTKKGYYDSVIFHRVIKGFMNQTGCPKGDGTGGQSIWGGFFQDELMPEKYRFDKPYVVSMANKGPNTNGSQFFITVVACPWLDNKHTIFGRVIKGIQTVCEINKIKTDKTQKPLINIRIMSARVL